jgi:DNA-binding transcriptional LysR family regulator
VTGRPPGIPEKRTAAVRECAAPDWNDFRYFLAIRRAGTLAGAARDLKVQHSTVGRRLDALEDALGARLFLRTPGGFVPTAAGAAVLPLIEEAERSLVAAGRLARSGDDRIEGVVRLTTSESFSGLLVRRLAELRDLHPQLIVEVLAGNRSLDLSRGEADLAVRIAATTQPDLICRRIGEAGWSMYAAAGYLARRGAPASPRDLAGHEVIAFDESMANVPGAIWLDRHGAGARVVIRGNSILAVLNAAIVGMGLAVIPCFMGDGETTLTRVTPEVLGTREIWLVSHPDAARSARVRCVIDFVAAVIGEESERLRGRA